MNKTNTVAWVAFIGGLFIPSLAHFTFSMFSMFYPATDSAIEPFLLIAVKMLLLVGFLIAVIASVILTINGWKRRKYVYFILPVLVLANPFQQPLYLETLDTYLNYRWKDKALECNIVGKTPDEVRMLFGEPSYVWTETGPVVDENGKMTHRFETYTGWNYHVIPFYWMGSKFQVFFVNGTVSNFEANDD